MLKRFLFTIIMLIPTFITAQPSPYPKVDKSVVANYETCLQYFTSIPAQNIKIKKKKKLIPLTSTPSLLNFFRKKEKWSYTIAISNHTIDKLSPILYDSLSTNGQIGVLAHELSHVHDFHTKKKKYLFKVFFSHFSKSKTDAFEYNTDLICIRQGMGHYLHAWSEDVQQKLKINQWEGKNTFDNEESSERYMRPETICNYLHSMKELYHDKLPATCN